MTSSTGHPYPFGLLAATRGARKAVNESKTHARARHSEARRAATRERLLRLAGDEAVEMVRNLESTRKRLHNPTAAVRLAAVHLLIYDWQAKDDVTAAMYMEMLNDPDLQVREAIIGALHFCRRKSKDPRIAQRLARIVADTNETPAVRRIAYFALRDVLGLFPFRHGWAINIPEQLDWNLIGCSLRQEEFAVTEIADLPTDVLIQRLETPLSAKASFTRAWDAFSAGEYSEVIHCCTKGLTEFPISFGALYLRACAHGNLGNLEAAIADFSSAIALMPEEPVFFRERSEAYRRLGLNDAAQTDEQMAVRLEGIREKLDSL